MNVFFSGIGGVGIGPLAQIALDAGYSVQGSDPARSLMTDELRDRGVAISADQDGAFLRICHDSAPLDWYVYTAALPGDHPELVAARELGIRTAKRDELLAHIIDEKHLKLLAVAGTHGKTTTTGMLVWTLKQLGVPVSYSVGTTLSWGPSGQFDPASEYFVYECDEFDRNFLKFQPYLSLITSIDYDHPDTYPTSSDYFAAFSEFVSQSAHTIGWKHDLKQLDFSTSSWQLGDDEVADIALPGLHNRQNATLVKKAVEYLESRGLATSFSEDSAFPAGASQDERQIAASVSSEKEGSQTDANEKAVTTILASFPGTNRRFEKLAEGLYTDYGHHPSEIKATLQMARELSDHVVLVYQPHQNVRQHEIKNQYTDDVFQDASDIYWLPTYLSREDPELAILTPQELTTQLAPDTLHFADLDDALWADISEHLAAGHLVLCMGAGSVDSWLREKLEK